MSDWGRIKMMTLEEKFELANKRVIDINTCLKEIEKTSDKMKNVLNSEVCLYDGNQKMAIYLSDMLAEEEMLSIRDKVMDFLTVRYDEFNNRLNDLLGINEKGETPKKVEPVEQQKIVNEPKPRGKIGKEIDVNLVKDMYLSGMSIQEVTNELHVRKDRVVEIVTDLGIKRKPGRRAKMDKPEEESAKEEPLKEFHYDEVKKMWAVEKKTIAEMVTLLGRSKEDIYNYLIDSGIKQMRPSSAK